MKLIHHGAMSIQIIMRIKIVWLIAQGLYENFILKRTIKYI